MLKLFKKTHLVKNYINKLDLCRHFANKMSKNEDNRLETFRNICDEIGQERSYNSKSRILQKFFEKGSDKNGFQGDLLLWMDLLIPGATQRVYNLQNKQMLKLFSRMFAADQQEMQRDLEQVGDISETLRKYFETSPKLKPQSESTLYLQDVDEFLKKLEQKTKEDEQSDLIRQLCRQATTLDLKIIIRLIKQDLRINAGARHILDALGPFAYPAYQSSRDLLAVSRQFGKKYLQNESKVATLSGTKISCKVGSVQVMTPISPMLANACKSVEEAFKKSPSGLYTEIKYDGERVQIHKRGNEFKFFSRNLKPVMNHKIKRFHSLIPKAFPGGGDMILDSEIILVDTTTGELLPFGSLGVNKKKEFMAAEVCIFAFDCLLFNGEDLTNLPFHKRRQILEDNIKPIKSCVQLSELKFLKTKNELSVMTAKVLKANLEGVVLKIPNDTYQPGKRGWLKVKKDYLFGGKMADTADLVVLGAWFGSGKKGGLLSIFLMGCLDRDDGLWKTVTKVHTGLDDAKHDEVHAELMALMERADPDKVPKWLLCRKALIPDYIAKSPNEMPVWEITGAEFTKSESHTAGGISIRFPRITRIRDDKSAEEANDLGYLQKLFNASKLDVNVDLLLSNCDTTLIDKGGDGDDGDDDMKDRIVEIESKINLTPKQLKLDEKDNAKDNEDATTSNSLKRTFLQSENESEKDTSSISSSPVEKSEESSKKKLKISHKDNQIRPATKQLKLDFSAHKLKKPKESELFKEIVAFFDADIKDENCKRAFEANGGTITKVTKNADLVFHKSTNIDDIDLAVCRENYKNSCRHLSFEWVTESLNKKACEPYPLYAVVLKS